MPVITSLASSDELESYSRTTINTNFDNLDKKLPFKVVGTVAGQADYVCDGTADDVQIQAAIDAVNAAGGGIVFIKAGTYNISNGNALPAYIAARANYCGLIIKDKVKLIGEGIGKTILNTATFNAGAAGDSRFISIVSSASGIGDLEISDMTIQVPTYVPGGGGYWGTCIFLEGTNNCILRDLYLINGSWGLYGLAANVSFNTTTKELTTDSYNNLVDDVTIDSYLGSAGGFYLKDLTIKNSKFIEAHDDSLIIVSSQNVQIKDNYFDGENAIGGAASGVIYILNDGAVTSDINGTRNIKIIGNTIRRSTGLPGYGVYILRAKDVEISHNYIDQTQVGIMSQLGEDINISNNFIKRSASYGICFNTGASGHYLKRITVSNNTIYNNESRGIVVESGILDSMNIFNISDNTIYDDQAIPTQIYGIYLWVSGTGTNYLRNFNVINNNIYNTTNPFTLYLGTADGYLGNIKNNLGVNSLYEVEMVYMKNTSGGDLVRGNVVVLKAVAAGNEFTTTTTQGNDLVIGMLAEDIVNNASGYVQMLGQTKYLKVDGTTDIAIGDLLGTFTTAGIAMKATVGDMAFAIALQAYATNDSAGVIVALLIVPRKL